MAILNTTFKRKPGYVFPVWNFLAYSDKKGKIDEPLEGVHPDEYSRPDESVITEVLTCLDSHKQRDHKNDCAGQSVEKAEILDRKLCALHD